MQHLHELQSRFKTTPETTFPGSVPNQCNTYTTSGGAPKRRPKRRFQDPFGTNATPTRPPEALQNDARNDVSRVPSGAIPNQCNTYTSSGAASKRCPKLHFQDPFRTNATPMQHLRVRSDRTRGADPFKEREFSGSQNAPRSHARLPFRMRLWGPSPPWLGPQGVPGASFGTAFGARVHLALVHNACRERRFVSLVLVFTLNNSNDNTNPGHIQVCCLGGAPPANLRRASGYSPAPVRVKFRLRASRALPFRL